MNHDPTATSVVRIAKWIREAALTDSWRPGHRLGIQAASLAEITTFHDERIQTALKRARRKTFVDMAKPFRRFFRNQGAVNDSLIEALHHLALQNQEMLDEIAELRAQVRTLRSHPQNRARRDEHAAN